MDHSQQPAEGFRGDLIECLGHLRNHLNRLEVKGTNGACAKRVKMAKFCRVSPDTVKSWLRERQLPKGEPLIRLTCFLRLQGYSLSEFDRQNKLHQSVTELIGYNLLSAVQISQRLGLSHEAHVYMVLRGMRGVSEEKKQLMWDIWKEQRVGLEKAKLESSGLYELGIFPKIPEGEASGPTTSRPPADPPRPAPSQEAKVLSQASNGRPNKDQPDKAVLNLLNALLDVIDLYPDKQLTASSFEAIALEAPERILRLTSYLNQLCAQLLAGAARRSAGGNHDG